MDIVAQVFDDYRIAHLMFTADEFRQRIKDALGEEILNTDFSTALLELFVMDVQNDPMGFYSWAAEKDEP